MNTKRFTRRRKLNPSIINYYFTNFNHDRSPRDEREACEVGTGVRGAYVQGRQCSGGR